MRFLLHSPRDTVAGAVAAAAVLAVIVNAMFLQGGRHPSPMFGDHVMVLPAMPSQPRASAAPAIRDASQAASQAASSAAEPAPAGALSSSPLPRPRPLGADRRSDAVPARRADPIGHLVRAVALREEAGTAVPDTGSERIEIVSSRRVAAVQRVLSDYGYGQLAISGEIDAATRTAIRKFELARQLPATGQVSDRLVRELAAMTGRDFD